MLLVITYVYYLRVSARIEFDFMSQNMEPKHTSGHSTAVAKQESGEFMCPECGKKFNDLDSADSHLHSVHAKHLQAVHGEFQKQSSM